MLVGENLRKSFKGKKEVLHGVDITVEPGQITVVIGPSGSGKTTLLGALSLLEPPDSGTISVCDRTYKFPLGRGEKIEKPWPKLITMVFQNLHVWPHLRLRENITLPLLDQNIPNSEKRLQDLIERYGMAEFINRYPNEASEGQCQRVAIARSLALGSAYILLDEVTSALDVEIASVVLEHLSELRDRGVGILIVTHSLGFARRAADRVVFLDEGKAIESGGRAVLDSPRTARVQRFLSAIEAAS